MKKKSTHYIAEGAIIAGIYAALTVGATLLIPYLTFGAYQFRVSEALTILPMFTPAAIPGLFIGCIISNTAGVAMGANIAGVWDILFGSVASLFAAIVTRWLKDLKIKGIPVLAPLPPVIFNSIIVGYELSLYIPDFSFIAAFISVGVGEMVVCYALGIPLYLAIKKTKIFKKI